MHGPSRGLASSSSSSSSSPSDHRDGHYNVIIAGGGAVGSALARMLLDDTTAASASAPDSDGLDSLDKSLGRGGTRKPSCPSPATAVIAFERAVSRQLPRSAAVG
jgi:hypothetical protein